MRIADDLLVGKAGPVFSVHLDAGPAINPARFPAFPLLKAPNNAPSRGQHRAKGNEMSVARFTKNFGDRKMGLALAKIQDEGGEIIRQIARREPAKVIALRTGMTPRHVYNLREGECQPSWPYFIALAMEYPELKAAIAHWLHLDKTDPAAVEAINQIRRIVDAMLEEGDQAQPEGETP
jgi:hypothetical protein